MPDVTNVGTKIGDGTRTAVETLRQEKIADLKRLVEALDRRVPRLERLGESAIARDAAELRKKAVTLIANLTGEGAKR